LLGVRWSADRTAVQILAALAINPEGGPLAKQTADGRRKRLGESLRPRLAEVNWRESSRWRWRKN
jgi:hypothetical protein